MPIRVVESQPDLESLESDWRRLSEAQPSSIFSSFDYVRLAWKHFHEPDDRLFTLVASSPDGQVTAIAPFCVRRRSSRGIPHRVVQLVAEWEGDRPGIVHAGSAEAAWSEIASFLDRERRDWDAIELAEQPVDGPEGRGWACLSGARVLWEQEPGPVDYYVPASPSWDEYLSGLSSRTRHEWRRHSRKLSERPGGGSFERIFDAGRCAEALERFVALERASWKGGAGIGVGKDEAHQRFYAELLPLLAERGQAAMFFLTTGGRDMAGAMLFLFGPVVYFRNITYSQEFQACSPGSLLGAEVFRFGIERGCSEIDMLGLQQGSNPQRHKTEWAKGLRPTVHLTGYRKTGRLLPFLVARRLRRAFAGVPPSPAPAAPPAEAPDASGD